MDATLAASTRRARRAGSSRSKTKRRHGGSADAGQSSDPRSPCARPTEQSTEDVMTQRLIWILWPGFLMAIPAVGLVFTLVDPADLHAFGEPLEISRSGAYTFGFLLLWMLGSACSALTC